MILNIPVFNSYFKLLDDFMWQHWSFGVRSSGRQTDWATNQPGDSN